MGKGGSDAPDYKGAARAEGQASKEITEQQTWANRPTQYSPWGTTQWEATPEYDRATGQTLNQWTQYETLSPELQRALDSQVGLQADRSELGAGMMDRVGQEFGQTMDWGQFGPQTGVGLQPGVGTNPLANQYGQQNLQQSSEVSDPMSGYQQNVLQTDVPMEGLQTGSGMFGAQSGYQQGDLAKQFGAGQPTDFTRGSQVYDPRTGYNQEGLQTGYNQEGLQTGLNDPSQTLANSENSLYERQTSRLDPQFQQEEEQLRIRLRGQGLRSGDQAFDDAMDTFNRRKTDAYQAAGNEASMLGAQDAERMFGMYRGQGEFGNTAQQQMNQNIANQAAFGNQAQTQMNADKANLANFYNQAQQQSYGMGLGQANLYNQAGQMAAGEDLSRAQFANTAQQQMNQNLAGQAQFYNQAQQQDYGQGLSQAELANQATQQMNQNAFQQGQFGNQALQQMNQNVAGQAGFFNQAQQTDTQNALQQAQLFNQAGQQENQNLANQANFYNQAQQGNFGQDLAAGQYNQDSLFRQADYSNQLRQQAIMEEMTRRGFSLNEANALISGQQVANPQFQSFSNATKSQTPQYNQAALNQGNFDQAQSQGFMSGITDLAAIGVPMMMSDRRLKTNINRIGTFKGYPLYSFNYIFGGSAVGVMSDEINQDAVVNLTGFDMVDTSRIREI